MTSERIITIRDEIQRWLDDANRNLSDPEISEWKRDISHHQRDCYVQVLSLIDKELERD